MSSGVLSRGDYLLPGLAILRKVINVLYDHGPLEKTDLSKKTGVHYQRLMKYVDWLESKGAVEKMVSDGKLKVSLTERGREFRLAFEKLHDFPPN